jgi:hypothetical protein
MKEDRILEAIKNCKPRVDDYKEELEKDVSFKPEHAMA